jgi:hypothetical protein
VASSRAQHMRSAPQHSTARVASASLLRQPASLHVRAAHATRTLSARGSAPAAGLGILLSRRVVEPSMLAHARRHLQRPAVFSASSAHTHAAQRCTAMSCVGTRQAVAHCRLGMQACRQRALRWQRSEQQTPLLRLCWLQLAVLLLPLAQWAPICAPSGTWVSKHAATAIRLLCGQAACQQWPVQPNQPDGGCRSVLMWSCWLR